MYSYDTRPKLGDRRPPTSRAKDALVKVSTAIAGGVMLVSALVISVVFFAVAVVVLLGIGGYMWWRTRELRKALREQLEAQERVFGGSPNAPDDVIEGVVIERTEVRTWRDS